MKTFTDYTLNICGKECNFKRGIVNKDILDLNKTPTMKKLMSLNDTDKIMDKSKKLEAEMNLIIADVETLKDEQRLYEEQGEIDKALKVIKEIKKAQKKVEKITNDLIKTNEENDLHTLMELNMQALGEKAEFFLTNITKNEFIENANTIDMAIITNIESIHILCMKGVSEKDIEKEIDNFIDMSLESSFRNDGRNSFDTV